MKRYLTLANLLLLVGTVQLLALWVYGLLHWLIGTLIVSTLWIAVLLAWEERRAK
jgi:hypothetical protein